MISVDKNLCRSKLQKTHKLQSMSYPQGGGGEEEFSKHNLFMIRGGEGAEQNMIFYQVYGPLLVHKVKTFFIRGWS